MIPTALTVGDPTLPALVFLHGVGGDGHSYTPQLDHFQRTHRCIAWHMPGYADSPTIDPYDWPQLATALIALLDSEGIASATFVGHSIGGMVLQTAMAMFPGRISAAVLSATSPAFGSRDGDFQQKFLQARLAPLDRGETLAALAPGIVDSLLGDQPHPSARADAIACMARVPEASYRSAMTAITRFDARASLRHISCPTLVLAGEHDSNAPAPMMERMASKIPQAQYRLIAGAGHLSYMEQPDSFNQCLSDFMAGAATGLQT